MDILFILLLFCNRKLFKVIQFPKVAGSYENILIDNTSIALSEDTAKQLFGKDYLHSIGKTVVLDNEGSKYVVHAIYKTRRNRKTQYFGVGLSRDPFVNESKESWTNYSYYGFFKVKPNTDLEKLEEKLSKWDDDHERIENRKMDGRIVEIISKLI